MFEQCKRLLLNLFNYDDAVSPPCFDFYFDSNNDGNSEVYKLIDFSMLDYELTNKNMVDKSIWPVPIKIITVIRLILCAVLYSRFINRLLRRLPNFYSNTVFSIFSTEDAVKIKPFQ